jgi:uracil-DNA glycosylase
MPIFHPSYLLRNQSREEGSPKWLTWQDMKTIRAKYDDLCSPPTDATDF